jgi:hypothetical protein
MTWIDRLAASKMREWYGPDISRHDRLMPLLQTYHRINSTEPSGSQLHADQLVWCLEHCKHKFRDFQQDGHIAWYFQDEQDAVMFSLRWSHVA